MTLYEKTHPELAIVSRILQQASIPLSQSQFEQQWTTTHLRTAFQWTRHLSSMFLTLEDTSTTSATNQHLTLTPMKIVKSYLTHYQNANDGFHGGEYKTRQSSYSNALPDISMARVPTETELLDPSTALQRRLLCNPGVTDMIRVEILSLYAIQQHLGALDSKPSIVFSEINPHALSIIKENALEDLVIGVQSHFLQLSQFQEANLLDFQNLTKSNEQKTKARILFDRIKASNSPVSEVEMVLIPQLRKYLELSRSEAWGVICSLREMIRKVTMRSNIVDDEQIKVDWDAVVDALSRLE